MLWRLGISGLALWWGFNALQMFTCESVSFGGGSRVVRVSCYDAPVGSLFSGDFAGWHAGLAISAVVLGVLFWLWGWPVVQYRRAVGVVAGHVHALSAATGQDARAIQEEIIRNGMTPGEWAVAHDLDPITFAPRRPLASG